MDTSVKKIHAKSFRTYFIFIRMQNKKANNKCINLVKDRWADTLRHLQHGRKPIPATWR